jgi:hypothetical protein
LVSLLWVAALDAQAAEPRARKPVRLPDIPGYRTVKCDFHIHTVFSDGSVWPDVRVEEAWREGLDAIAITDHLEYQPHKGDLSTNHNRSFEIARSAGDTVQVTVIRGSEITRDMPPGHLKALFLSDARRLKTEAWRDAVAEASAQNAFIFWNHPGWRGQQEDGLAKWYPEHSELLDRGQLHGIEVVNGEEYYPEAHRWCLEKRLTLLSNSDIHSALNLEYAVHDGDHRPLTLVFARDTGPAAIREALFDRRTAVYSGNRLIGDEKFLRPVFDRSVRLLASEVRIKGTGRVYLQIQNDSEVTFELVRLAEVEGLTLPERLSLYGGRTSLFAVRGLTDQPAGRRDVRARYRVTNLLVAPDQGMEVELVFVVTAEP